MSDSSVDDQIEVTVHVGPHDGPMPDEITMREVIKQEQAKGRLVAFTGRDFPSKVYCDVLPGEKWKPVFAGGRFVRYDRVHS